MSVALRRPGPRQIAAGMVGVAVAVAALAAGSNSSAAPAPRRPNILLILVDDQATNTFSPTLMPQTFRWIVRPGTKFTSGLAAPPLCCPDRAGILTGDYPHNNGVFSNAPGYATLTDKGDTLPVWLTRAGYRTGFVGKFLNNYTAFAGNAPAPGFGTWFAYDDPTRYFNYTVSDNGTPRTYGTARRDYTTDVFTRQALRFLRTPSRKPFFLFPPTTPTSGAPIATASTRCRRAPTPTPGSTACTSLARRRSTRPTSPTSRRRSPRCRRSTPRTSAT